MPPQQGVLEIEGPADECDKKEELQHQLEEDGKASFPFEHEQQEPSLWDEWRAQIKTAWPTLLGMLLYKVPWMVSLRFVGGIGAGELAAAALASTLCNVTGMSLSVGLSSALTTLAGQARGHALRKRQLQHNADVKAWEKEQSFLDETETLDELGDEDLEDVSFLPSNDASSSLATTNNKNKPLMPLVFLFRGMFIQLLLVIPVGIWWLCGIEDVLVRLGQGEELSHMTQNYLRILTPGLWAYSVNWTLTCWLQTMEMADVPAIAAGIGLTAHVPLNFLFVYGLNWGYLGCAAATVCCQGLQPIFIVCYLCSARGKARLWDQMGASPSSGSPPSTLGPTLRLAVSKGLGQYLSLALPGIVIISEWWASEISIFLSGRFDNAAVTLGAMTLYQSINTALFMFPGKSSCLF